MDASLLNPSRFLKSQAFAGREPTFTITKVRIEELEDQAGKQKAKGIITFAETPKEWVLNRTNVEAMKAFWGRETDDWLGKRITLFAADYHDNTTGEDTTCIRVRGSPDIPNNITVTISLPRKKPFTMAMVKTMPKAKPNGKATTAPPKPPPAPATPEPTPAPAAAAAEPSDEEKAAIFAAEFQQAGEF